MNKGQLVLECSCGNSEVLDDNVENGLSLLMTVEAKSEWVFKCSKCGHSFNLKLKPLSDEFKEVDK